MSGEVNWLSGEKTSQRSRASFDGDDDSWWREEHGRSRRWNTTKRAVVWAQRSQHKKVTGNQRSKSFSGRTNDLHIWLINKSISQSIIILSEQISKALQSLYINMGKMERYYMPGNDSEKKVSFKFLFHVDSVTDDVTSGGRLFQLFAATTQNARSPTVRRRVCGGARSADDAERKRCRPGRSATCCRLSVRYVCARPFRHRYALPDWTIFALGHKANADGDVEAWSGHTDSHWTLVQHRQRDRAKLKSNRQCNSMSRMNYLDT